MSENDRAIWLLTREAKRKRDERRATLAYLFGGSVTPDVMRNQLRRPYLADVMEDLRHEREEIRRQLARVDDPRWPDAAERLVNARREIARRDEAAGPWERPRQADSRADAEPDLAFLDSFLSGLEELLGEPRRPPVAGAA